jgi:hypothetical protein
MYSQNNEEEVILRVFEGQIGSFLDIGAYDGVSLSNTRALAERGWSGALIEGSSFSFQKLFSLYGGNKKFTLINAMLDPFGKNAGKIVKMWEAPNCAVTTISPQNFEKWQNDVVMHSDGGAKFSEIFVAPTPFAAILDFFKSQDLKFDFVSIDIEGGSADVAMLYEPDEFGTSLLCVEHDDRDSEIVARYAKLGFVLILKNDENIILSRGSQQG